MRRPSAPRRRHADDRGAVAVEAALITPILVVLVFGIIEFSFLLKDKIAMTAAVRAGTRTASSEPRIDSFVDDTAAQMTAAVKSLDPSGLKDATLWIYSAGTRRDPEPDPGSCESSCVKYTWQGGKWQKASGGWDPQSINACAGNEDQTVVGVQLDYLHPFTTGLFGSGVSMSDRSVMIFEPVPAWQTCG